MTFILNALTFRIWEWCSWKLEDSLVAWAGRVFFDRQNIMSIPLCPSEPKIGFSKPMQSWEKKSKLGKRMPVERT